MTIKPAETLGSFRPEREGYAEEEELLGKIAAELEGLGESAAIRLTRGGRPFLCARGVNARFNEEITAVRRDGAVRAMWAWDEELPHDPREAAAAVRRVINPVA